MNGAGLASAPGLSCGHTEGARTVGGDKPLGRGVPVAVSSRGSTRGSTGWLRLLLSTLTVLPSRPGPALGPPGRVLQHLADTRFRTRTKSKPLPFRNCPPRAKAPGKASSQHAADQHRPPGGAEAPLSWALGSRTLAKKFAFLFLRASRYRSNAHVVRQKAWLDQGPRPAHGPGHLHPPAPLACPHTHQHTAAKQEGLAGRRGQGSPRQAARRWAEALCLSSVRGTPRATVCTACPGLCLHRATTQGRGRCCRAQRGTGRRAPGRSHRGAGRGSWGLQKWPGLPPWLSRETHAQPPGEGCTCAACVLSSCRLSPPPQEPGALHPCQLCSGRLTRA